ncbi:MAG: hypothetical protein H7240_11730 [Glaciimonas sp.]|nr:hypothetical protein [Glaciimonas sp.]
MPSNLLDTPHYRQDQLALLSASAMVPESADALVQQLSGCFPERLIQRFLQSLQPISETVEMEKHMTEFVRIGSQFTPRGVIKTTFLTEPKALLTLAALKQLAQLVLTHPIF